MTTTIRTKATRAVAAIAAVGALAFGAGAGTVTSGGSSSASTRTTGTQAAKGATAGMPQLGSQVTGTTLTKLKSLVLAKYAGGPPNGGTPPTGTAAS